MLLVEDATNTAVDVATSVFDALGAVVKESNDEDSAQSGTTFEAGTPSQIASVGEIDDNVDMHIKERNGGS